MPNQFWNIKNISESEGELTIYGDIGESWFGDSVSARKFDQALKNLGNVSRIVTRINSGGGDVFTGHHIYAALKDHPARIITKTEGLAASAASVIAMAADELIVHPSDFIMIHNPSASKSGEAKDFEKMVSILGVIKDGIVNAYVAKTGKTKDEISKLMDEEKWMTGEDAVNMGFADKLADDPVSNFSKPILNGNLLIVNGLSHDISNCKNKPPIKNESDDKKPGSFSFLDKILNLFKDDDQVEKLVTNILVNNLPKAEEINNKQEVDQDMEFKNIEDLKKAHPELVNQIEQNAVNTARQSIVDEALKNERTRFHDIEEISKNIAPELVNKAKYETFVDAKDLAFESMKNDSSKSTEYLENVKKESEESGANGVKGQPNLDNKEIEKQEEAAAAEKMASFGNQRRAK